MRPELLSGEWRAVAPLRDQLDGLGMGEGVEDIQPRFRAAWMMARKPLETF